jgi:uncharacterized membrane protein HdeD (DUF308 family)
MTEIALAIEIALVVAGVLMVVGAVRWRNRGLSRSSWTLLFAIAIGIGGVLEMIQAVRVPQMGLASWAGIAAGVLFLAAALTTISSRNVVSAGRK